MFLGSVLRPLLPLRPLCPLRLLRPLDDSPQRTKCETESSPVAFNCDLSLRLRYSSFPSVWRTESVVFRSSSITSLNCVLHPRNTKNPLELPNLQIHCNIHAQKMNNDGNINKCPLVNHELQAERSLLPRQLPHLRPPLAIVRSLLRSQPLHLLILLFQHFRDLLCMLSRRFPLIFKAS